MKQAIILASLLWTLTPQAVARRCAGEFSAAVPQCACAIRNRLDAGWSPAKVLTAFYAPDAYASEAQVQAVADVLSGAAMCRPDLYFMYGKGDEQAAHLTGYTPALVVRHGDKEVWFYSRNFREEQ